jgi:beta-N-acetylhexosaminidase
MTTRQAQATSLRDIGQLFVVGFDGTEMTPQVSSLLKKIQPAGVILFARNIQSGAQTWRLLRDCRKCVAHPLFTCVDLEGGRVDRFRDTLGPSPSAADVFATGDRKLFRKHGAVIGESCHALGFNVDFAPSLDLAFEASRSVMGSRAVSADPADVVAYAREFLAGLRGANVLGCGKHFPGLGEGKLDTHHELPVIDKPLAKLWREDIAPYRELRRQLPFVMISHAAYPRVTNGNTPASLSKPWITGILNKRIGYRNLIVSDDLEMGGVLSAAPIGQAATEFIRAGGDLCLICHRMDYIAQAYDQVIKRVDRDARFARRASEAVGRVLAFKNKWAGVLGTTKVPSAAALAGLSRRLAEFGELVGQEGLEAEARTPRK